MVTRQTAVTGWFYPADQARTLFPPLLLAAMLGACGGGGGCVDVYPDPDYDYRSHTGLDSADMNGDGLTDLVFATLLVFGSEPEAQRCGGTARTDGSVTVLLQDFANPGQFLPPQRYTTFSDLPKTLKLADLNGDSMPDVILTSRWNTEEFEVLLHDPLNPGQLGPAMRYNTVFEPHQIGVGDIDMDGRVDIALAGDTTLTWHRQLSGVSFSGRNDIGSGFSAVILTDFDGDGLLDIATLDGTPDERYSDTRRFPGDVLIYQQSAGLPGIFSQVQRLHTDAGFWMLGAGDINEDDRADIVATDTEESYRFIQAPTSPLMFSAVTPHLRADSWLNAEPIITDLNGDAREDIIIGEGGGGRAERVVTVFLQGEPPGTFTDKTEYLLKDGETVLAGSSVDAMTIADLNGDLLPDIAVSNGRVLILFQIQGAPGTFAESVQVAGEEL